MKLDDIYQEIILDHYRNPRCSGCLTAPHTRQSLYNPLCGDQIELELKAREELIEEIGFTGHGCSISQASASMMAALCKGKPVAEARLLLQHFREMMRGARTAEDSSTLGDAVALEGVRKFSARVKCAMLAWEALEKSLDALQATADSAAPTGASNGQH